jgi:spore germination protein
MKTEQLNVRQFITFTAAAILGVDVLLVQQRIVAIANQDAWISLSIGGLLTIAAGVAAYLLAASYPDKDFPDIILAICGNFFGKIVLFVLGVYILIYSGLSARIFVQALKMFLVDRTPIYVLLATYGIATTYADYKGINTIGNIIDIIFPITIITIITILLLAIPQADFVYMKPIFFENTKSVVKAILPSYTEFTGYSIILYIYCHTKRTKGSVKFFLAGLFIPIFFYIALTVVSIMVFGPEDLNTLIYPTLTLLKAIEFPTTFMERLESFAAIIWIGTAFLSAIIFRYMSSRNITVLFSIKDSHRKYVALVLYPIILLIALSPSSGLVVLDYASKLSPVQTFLGLVVIPLLSVIGFIKKRRMKTDEA